MFGYVYVQYMTSQCPHRDHLMLALIYLVFSYGKTNIFVKKDDACEKALIARDNQDDIRQGDLLNGNIINYIRCVLFLSGVL